MDQWSIQLHRGPAFENDPGWQTVVPLQGYPKTFHDEKTMKTMFIMASCNMSGYVANGARLCDPEGNVVDTNWHHSLSPLKKFTPRKRDYRA